MMGKKTVLEVKVTDVEKRKYPVKHYIYILEVSWSEGTTTVIYRRYSDFFEFQCELLERFPEEAGAKDPAMRMIPFLPGKKLLGRSQTRSVAEKRKEKLNDYCRTLIRLPPKISDDSFVIDFFNVRPEDLAPSDEKPASNKKGTEEPIQEISDPLVLERFVAVADYEKQKKNECSLEAGQTVEVIDKNANGWWFVNVDDFNEGWVPATFLEPIYGGDDVGCQVLEPGEEEIHIAMSGYTAQNDDEVTFEKGVLLEVFEKNLDGWWKVRYQGQVGFAPAAFLQRYHGAVINNEVTTGAQIVSTVQDAISSNGHVSGGWKPSDSARKTTPSKSTTLKSPEPTSPKSPEPAGWKTLEATRTVTSPKLPTKFELNKKPSETVRSPTPKSSEDESVTSPKPVNPKPSVQKFAPTWHSMQQPYIDKEPIYAPTPRISPAKKKKPPPPAKPKPSTTSPTLSPTREETVYDQPQPLYECIDQPKEQIYVTIGDFKAADTGDGLSFMSGVLVSVITKNSTGWWYVDLDGVEGWVPSSYLESTSKTKTVSPVSTEPPPPLPDRNPAVPQPKRELMPAFDKPTRPALSPLPKKKPLPPKAEHVPVTRVKTLALGSSNKSTTTSLRRSQSTESLDRDTPSKPVVKRAQSPPAVHLSASNGWKPKPVPVKPAKSPALPSRHIEVKTQPNKTLSPRTSRLTKAQISTPAIQKSPPAPNRHTSVSKATSLQSINKSVPPKSSTMNPSKSIGSLISPEANSTRTPSVSSRPVKPTPPAVSPFNARKTSTGEVQRPPPYKKMSIDPTKKPSLSRKVSDGPKKGGDSVSRPPVVRRGTSEDSIDTGPHHFSELESKLRLRKPTDNDRPKRAAPPQRPKAPPSRPKEPPKRPGPPKPGPPKPAPPGVKRPPPPKPYVPPSLKKPNNSYLVVGDYVGEKESCLTLSEGDWVEVLERNNDGWWFVELDGSQGWAPSSFLEERSDPKPSRPSRPKLPAPTRTEAPRSGPTIPSRPRPPPARKTSGEQEYASENNTATTPTPKPRARVARKNSGGFARAVSAYEVPAYEDSGIGLVQGRLYEVKEKTDSGWWLVRDGDIEGWAPASHLEAI